MALGNAHYIVDMKYSVLPVVMVAGKVKDGEELSKLVEGPEKLSKSDLLVICTTEECGEDVIADCGDLQLRSCLKDLRDEGAQFGPTVSDLVVSYQEFVSQSFIVMCLVKPLNKHNLIYLPAEFNRRVGSL